MKKSYLNSAALSGMALFVGAVVSLSSCSADAEEVMNNSSLLSGLCAPVRVHVSDFSITMGDFASGGQTRAAVDPTDYNGVGVLTLAFYSGSDEVLKSTQIKSDHTTYTNFGEFSFTLAAGTYTMVALGYYYYVDDVFTLTSPTLAAFTSERPRETFCLTQSVTVSNGIPLDLDVTLNRISAKLRILSTDGRPAAAKKIRTTYDKGAKSFNPTTGLATVDTGFSLTNNPSSAAGATIDVGSYPFLYSDEETMTITIQALDADDNVLYTKIVPNVPLQRNRETTLTGEIFSITPSAAGFRLETDWITGNTVNF